MQKANALGYVYELLLPVGFLALLAPEVLLLALPSLGVNLLADFPPMHEVDTLIYAAPIAPFVALAAVMGTARLLRWLRREEAGRLPRRAAPWAVALLVLLCLGVAQRQYGYLPGGGNFRLYPVTDRDRLATTLFAQIPADAAVSAQDKLNPHTSGRTTSYIFPRVLDAETGDADTVLIDAAGPSWPQHPNDVYASVQDLLQGGWGVVDGSGGYLLLRRGEPNQEIPQAFYTPWRQPEAESPAFTQEARFGPLLLTGLDVVDDDHGETVVRTHWNATERTDEPLTIRLRYLDWDGGVLYDSVHSPPVIGLWYPTTAWPVGEEIVASSVPWPVRDGRFTLLVSVTEGAEADAPALPVTEVAPQRPLPDGGHSLRIGGFERTAQGWQPAPGMKPPANVIDARFGNVALEAAEVLPLARGVPTATVALAWRAVAPPARDDSIFIHLLGADGARAAQWDGAPRDAGGPLPMTAWPVGMAVTGHYALSLPADLPPGEYRLVAGLYDWAGGAAVPAEGTDTVDGQAAGISTLRIE